MRFKKKVAYSLFISIITLGASIVSTITPCEIAPSIPNAISKWTLCTLNPTKIDALYPIKNYFGHTPSLMTAMLITVLITFMVSFLTLHFITRKTNKN